MTSVPPTQPPAAPETEAGARIADYEREWLWNEATDDHLAGYGIHMSQMLYRLPRDGQTRDMQASIESMVADLAALIERVRVVEGERDRLRRWKDEALPVIDGLQDLGDALGLPLGERITGPAAVEAARNLTARAESAEAAHRALQAAVEALADEWEAGTFRSEPREGANQ